jgi:DNA-binding protein H-NS
VSVLNEEIFDTLPVQDLIRVRDLAEYKREEKLEDAKQQVLDEMKSKFEQLGLSYDEVMGLNRGRRRRRDSGSTLAPKYRGPTGEEWSGRGFPPLWIREIEEGGGDREDYRIPELE